MNRTIAVLFLAMIAIQANAKGRLLATGGLTALEGSAGGGITPWALIAGYGANDEIGVTAFYTHLDITDFKLRSAGVAIGVHDSFEISFARQRLELGTTAPGESIEQDIFGLKWRIAGDAVYDQDRLLPQIVLGVQYNSIPQFFYS